MRIFNFFKSKEKESANKAKERLQIVLAYERRNRSMPDFFPKMQKELMDVIRKYVSVSDEAVEVNLDRGIDCTMLEVNVELPMEPVMKASQQALRMTATR